MLPLVSVVMPVHNRETLVGDAIGSIRAQTEQRWELIVVDDASTDSTRDVVRKIMADDKRISLVCVDKQSTIAAVRNIGLHRAQGQFIAAQDSDDRSHPARLERQANVLLNRCDLAVASSWANVTDSEGTVRWCMRTSCHPVDLALECPLVDPLVHAAAMIRRSALLEIGGYDESPSYSICDDSRLWVQLTRTGYRLSAIPAPLYSILWHEGNVTSRPESRRQARRAYSSFWPVSEEDYVSRAIAWIDQSLKFLSGRVAIWGTGSAATMLCQLLAEDGSSRIVGFIDSSPSSRIPPLDGFPIISPDAIASLKCDQIAIASIDGQASIEENLTGRGMTRERDFMPVARLLALRRDLSKEMQNG